MRHLLHFFTVLRHLSVDVVLGAIASGGMIVWLLDKPMPWIWWVALPIAVWVIYTSDHLMDAYRLKDEAHTPRHLFHHHYFKPIAIVWALLLLSCVTWVAYWVPVEMLYLGLGMGGLVLLHLGFVSLIGDKVSWLLHKELGVGFIYAVGIWGGPVVMHEELRLLVPLLLFVQFFMLVMINLLFFSLYEAETDRWDGHTSFVLAIGKQYTQRIILLFSAITVAIGIWILFYNEMDTGIMVVEGIYALMLGLLLGITFMPAFFGKYERYRYYGDGAFLLPVLVWLF
jgi:hypothetical protein